MPHASLKKPGPGQTLGQTQAVLCLPVGSSSTPASFMWPQFRLCFWPLCRQTVSFLKYSFRSGLNCCVPVSRKPFFSPDLPAPWQVQACHARTKGGRKMKVELPLENNLQRVPSDPLQDGCYRSGRSQFCFYTLLRKHHKINLKCLHKALQKRIKCLGIYFHKKIVEAKHKMPLNTVGKN